MHTLVAQQRLRLRVIATKREKLIVQTDPVDAKAHLANYQELSQEEQQVRRAQ